MISFVNSPLDLMLTHDEIYHYLTTDNRDEVNSLLNFADRVRQEYVGGDIHIRALLNISNYCERSCLYCGLGKHHKNLKRYRMTEEEILTSIAGAVDCGYKTIVLQAGEDMWYSEEYIKSIITEVKKKFDIIITLSLGEREKSSLETWYTAGASRYLLKHETSDESLYTQLNPGMQYYSRINQLKTLKKIGYQTGSGIMVGLPGQTYKSVANDIVLFDELGIDMIGCGPYIENPHTPLASLKNTLIDKEKLDQYIQNKLDSVLRVIALTRIVTKNTLIPATTATEVSSPKKGRISALDAGANVVMLDITPEKYRQLYEIYPKESHVNGIRDYSKIIKDISSKSKRPISEDYGHRGN